MWEEPEEDEEGQYLLRRIDRECAEDLGLYAEPWDGYQEEPEEALPRYKSIHELPQEFFEIDREDLRDQYPEFFE